MMKRNGRRGLVAVVALAASALLLTACGGSNNASDNTLRVAFGSNGSDGQKVWDAAAAKFKADNPGWNVEFQVQDDDLYETVGLQNLLTSGNAPDVYFEWAGARLANKVRDGYAADITSLIDSSGLGGEFEDGAFGTTTIDGKVYMVPFTSDVTNVIWYNKDIFAQQGLAVPTTWAELMDVSAKLKAAGVTPFAVGNKDLWVAGNWIGHVLARVAGEQVYDEVLSQKKPLNSPEFVKGMEYVKQLQENGYVNESANTISDNEGYALFFDGKAAMLPIGSWIVGIQQEQAPDFQMGWFNLPPIDGGAGDQASIMGVTTGYIVNAKSAKQDKAAEFLKDAFSADLVTQWVDAGFTPVAKGAEAAARDALTQQMVDLLGSGAPIVAPPDTGYDLKVADALNTATTQVLDGVKTPQEALDEAQAKLDAQ
jgi:ABC-type glycerol-3-phosphate transport system substrate-binding protein